MKFKKKFNNGGRFFGKNVLKRLLKEDISEVRIFSRDEKKQFDLRNSINDKRFLSMLRHRDPFSLDNSLKGIDMVFHVLLKQVLVVSISLRSLHDRI